MVRKEKKKERKKNVTKVLGIIRSVTHSSTKNLNVASFESVEILIQSQHENIFFNESNKKDDWQTNIITSNISDQH